MSKPVNLPHITDFIKKINQKNGIKSSRQKEKAERPKKTGPDLEIVFENGESICVPSERILDLTYTPSKPEQTAKKVDADALRLEIGLRDSEELVYNPDDAPDALGMHRGNPTSNRVTERPNILGRLLCYNDIAGIELHDQKGETNRTIYPAWEDEDETQGSINRLQHVCLESQSDGPWPITLTITIEKP